MPKSAMFFIAQRRRAPARTSRCRASVRVSAPRASECSRSVSTNSTPRSRSALTAASTSGAPKPTRCSDSSRSTSTVPGSGSISCSIKLPHGLCSIRPARQDAEALIVGQRAPSRTARGRTRSSRRCGRRRCTARGRTSAVPATRRRMRVDGRDRHEVDVVDRELAPAVDEVDAARADAVDRRDVQLHRLHVGRHRPGAAVERAPVARRRRRARAARRRDDRRRCRSRRGVVRVDDDVHVALAVQQHLARAVARDRPKAHRLEHLAERLRLARSRTRRTRGLRGRAGSALRRSPRARW